MKFKDFIQDFEIVTKNKIAELAMQALTNTEKKARLDDYLLEYLQNILGVFKPNLILRFIISKYVIPNVPTLTQTVYNLLKTRIEEIRQ